MVARRFLLGLNLASLLIFAVSEPAVSMGSDPDVRMKLRNIDEPLNLETDATLQTTMDRLKRGELTLPIELDGLFGTSRFVPPDEFRGAEMRRWQDNTGAYEVEGRLAIIYPDKVRLMKPNGRTTTVPMRRLSVNDQAYVRWVAEQLTQSGNATFLADQLEAAGYPSR